MHKCVIVLALITLTGILAVPPYAESAVGETCSTAGAHPFRVAVKPNYVIGDCCFSTCYSDCLDQLTDCLASNGTGGDLMMTFICHQNFDNCTSPCGSCRQLC